MRSAECGVRNNRGDSDFSAHRNSTGSGGLRVLKLREWSYIRRVHREVNSAVMKKRSSISASFIHLGGWFNSYQKSF